MQCSQAKPFTITSTNAKMGSPSIQSYEKGGMVTKPDPLDAGVYTADKGAPPMDIDQMSALTPAQRKAAEARMKQPKKK
jgi:hypothetical protein